MSVERESLPHFKRLQYAFAGNIRDPDHHPPPAGVNAERMAVYRRLVYSNVEGYLETAYPVLRGFYSDAAWHELVRAFFVRHRAHSAQFHRAAEEFLDFVLNERGEHPDDPPFLRELAHYEWLELSLYILDVEADLSAVDTSGEPLDGVPVLSPLVRSVVYDYPVHELDPADPPAAPPEAQTYLVVYRDLDDDTHFLRTNAVTARLLERLKAVPDDTGRRHLEAIAEEMQHPDPEAVLDGGAEILADLLHRDVLLGVRAAPHGGL